MQDSLIWYASYASNLSWHRFRLYLEGGHLAANGRHHPGARNPAPPVDSVPYWMPGQMYFATESATWGGGRALFDAEASGLAASRAWLITAGQFCDVMAQEMQRPVGTDFSLPSVPGRENWVRAGDGHYETLVCVGRLRDCPVVTFCPPWRMTDVEPLAPSPAYLAVINAGLRETFGWSEATAGWYLAGLAGARAGKVA